MAVGESGRNGLYATDLIHRQAVLVIMGYQIRQHQTPWAMHQIACVDGAVAITLLRQTMENHVQKPKEAMLYR